MKIDLEAMRVPQPESIIHLLGRLWPHIVRARRIQLVMLLALMLIASLAEIISIGSILPFLGALTAPERVFAHPTLQPLFSLLAVDSPQDVLLPLVILFGLAALLAGLVRLLLLWSTTRLSFAIGADLSLDIYRRTLFQPYSVHLARNSSEIINGISGKAYMTAVSTVLPLLSIVSSLLLFVLILSALLYIQPIVAVIAATGFSLIYIVIAFQTRKKLTANGELIASQSTNVIKALQEGLGGIRDVLIDGTQNFYCATFRRADQPLRRAQGNNLFIAQSPRFAVESLGMIFIGGLAYGLSQGPEGITYVIPILGTLALGAQRLLPVLQQTYGSWSAIQGGRASLLDILQLLEQPLPAHIDQSMVKPLSFQDNIHFSRVSFRYDSDGPWVLNDIDIKIPRGSRVGIIGTTGSGKSTLIDIAMALLTPTQGELKVDGEPITRENAHRWQLHIAHVPQTIFLADNTIARNIAFGIPTDQIDILGVKHAAHQARIGAVIESWPDAYQTVVGERGARLSGGQRQRIGIARALYKHADVIIFDEATSALDSDTEKAVMDAVDQLDPEQTILIIAHRLETLRNCSQIIELKDGHIHWSGRYEDLINRTQFRASGQFDLVSAEDEVVEDSVGEGPIA